MEGENRNFLISHVLHCLIFSPYMYFREGRTNAYVKGDYQRIGDVMLRNMRTLKVDKGLKQWTVRIVESVFSLVNDGGSRLGTSTKPELTCK